MIWVHRPRSWMQRNGWCPSVDEVASGLSPRKIRLATGSLRRSFFTLGRLLALASKQQSMALQPRRAWRRVGAQDSVTTAPPEFRSRMAMPRAVDSAAPPRRLGQPRMRGCAWDKVHPWGGSSLPSRPGSALKAVAGRSKNETPDQAPVPCSEGPQERKRCCKALDEWRARTGRVIA